MKEELLRNALREIEQFYGGVILNGGILESAWLDELEKLSLQQVQVAIARLFKNNPKKYGYFPSINDILELARGSLPAENSEVFKVHSINNLQLPPEDDQKAHKRGLIGRLYLHLKAKKRVGTTELEKQDFYEKFEKYSIEELSNLLEIERPEKTKSNLITPGHAATPEAQEYTRKLHQLITGKTL